MRTLEAKDRLSELIAEVEVGGTFFVTRRRKRVAMLTGIAKERSASTVDLLERFRHLGRSVKKGPEFLRALVEAGRRHGS